MLAYILLITFNILYISHYEELCLAPILTSSKLAVWISLSIRGSRESNLRPNCSPSTSTKIPHTWVPNLRRATCTYIHTYTENSTWSIFIQFVSAHESSNQRVLKITFSPVSQPLTKVNMEFWCFTSNWPSNDLMEREAIFLQRAESSLTTARDRGTKKSPQCSKRRGCTQKNQPK